MEQMMLEAVAEESMNDTVVRKFEQGMPIGHHRVLGFSTHLVTELLIHLRNQWNEEAQLLCYQALGMIETF